MQKILIMDEPSAPLTSAEVESMFEVVERLRKEGVSIIYISHRLKKYIVCQTVFWLCVTENM